MCRPKAFKPHLNWKLINFGLKGLVLKKPPGPQLSSISLARWLKPVNPTKQLLADQARPSRKGQRSKRTQWAILQPLPVPSSSAARVSKLPSISISSKDLISDADEAPGKPGIPVGISNCIAYSINERYERPSYSALCQSPTVAGYLSKR
eukprot:1161180-Pelagomonas_calceolata.AAC.2